MRSSKEKKPPSLKQQVIKAAAAVLIFAAALFLISEFVFWPYTKIWSADNNYDILFAGASRTYKGIIPLEMDKLLDANTYLTGSDSCDPEARYALVESGLDQQSLKTVVLEVSYDAMVYYEDQDIFVFDIEPMARLDGLGRRVKFGLTHFNFWDDDYDTVYPTLMSYGIVAWGGRLMGHDELKGAIGFPTFDQSLTPQEAENTYNIDSIRTDYQADREEWIDKIIDMCKEKGVRVVVINTPDSERKLWQCDGWNVFDDYLDSIRQKHGITVLDFNLYKDRQSLFDDKTDFFDPTHLSENGAKVFTPLLAEMLQRDEKGEDLSGLFYSTYDEAKACGTYAEAGR